MGPAYHPEWLVTFWLTTPGLNLLNPHYVLIVLAVILAAGWFMKKRRTKAAEILDEEDQVFKHLLLKKKVIEQQLQELEARLMAAEVTEESFRKMKQDYHSHLDQVNKELEQYT
ncbi:hypothetical protein [Mesobacillus subterraneus]|uniref:Uncharacterized protein n=1 Tax=Mesobacillus subterraneus TaxID=285983 RepID=A0A427TTQ5_9BACI|nr:hypothetical protein [Mesobacillus subterraneus]RSD27827.1 hypothetical protein EJA10_08635 [Mesobacillus subterraneus]